MTEPKQENGGKKIQEIKKENLEAFIKIAKSYRDSGFCGGCAYVENNLESFIQEAENRIIERVMEELNKLPVGHTPDGKNHWVDYKAIKDLKKKLEEEMK